jgi:collagen type III alpha
MDVPFELWGQRGWAGVDIVGEAHYAEAIRDLFGDEFLPDGCELTASAQLVPEQWNRHDPNAVGVWVGGRQVGYLSRDDAARYAPALSKLVEEGWAPQVGARVWAASGYQGRAGITGSVRIDLAEPHLIVPANRAPEVAYQLLPFGNAIELTGEEKHLDALLPWLRPEGECWVHVTLHEVHEQSGPGTRELIEVFLDDAPVGRLSPRMSGELLPAVRHLASYGRLTVARAMVRGNRIKIEVVLHAARARELPESWLAAIAGSQPVDVTVVTVGSGALVDRPGSGGEPGAVTVQRPAGVARPVVIPGGRGPGRPDPWASPAATAVLWSPATGPAPAIRPGPAPATRPDPAAPARPSPAPPAGPSPAPPAGPSPAPPAGPSPALPAGPSPMPPAGIRSVPGSSPRPRSRPADPAKEPGRSAAPVRTAGSGAAGPGPAVAAPDRPGVIPPRPSGIRFAVPPGWPTPPVGWSPPAGWRPDPDWPPAPDDWQWWVPFWT